MYTDETGKKWFKGNLHTHTKISDGSFSPENAIELYKNNGYDFLSLTDHWKWNNSSESEGITIISGIEYDFGKSCSDGIYHIVAIGCNKEPDVKKGTSLQTVIDEIHKKGGIACLAHPAWSLNSPDDLMKLKNVDMCEIFNSISDIPFNCRAYSGSVLDIMAAKGCVWNISAADDTHFYKESDTCRSFIYVNCEDGSGKEILKAIKQGKYYASQGPKISVELKGDTLYVKSSPVCEMVFFTDKAYVPDRCITGENLCYGEYKIKDEESFVRVEVKNKEGKYAWSQYYLTK